MSRFKLTAMAALLAIPLAACNEGTPPPPEGSIDGQVSIEGQGVAGVTVSLSDGTSQTTGTDGRFAFAGVEGGTYTVSISGFAADATFANTSQTATIASQGQTVTVNFSGTYVRTASIQGSVTVENDGQSGISVRLSGVSDASTTTDARGQYVFSGLRAGAYEVEISGFDADAVGFSSTSKGTTVGVGETEVLSFDGTYLRTAGIVGRVSVEGDGLAGVTVSLSGSESRTATTDQAGQYAFSELRAGTYQVGISNFNVDDYEFSSTSESVTVTLGQTANVPFDGTRLRTAGISGRVSVEGTPLADVSVVLAGASADSATTNANGQYAFTGLAAGDYTVTISGYNADAYAFATATTSVTLADDESNITNFAGTHTRSANVWGNLYLDANGNDEYDGETTEDLWRQSGIAVTLEGPGVGQSQTTTTDAQGVYKFDSLATGTYKVLSAAPDSMLTRLGIGFGGLQSGMVVNVAPGSTNTLHLPFDIHRQTITVSAVMGDGKGKTGAGVKDVEVVLYPTYRAANDGTGALGTEKTDSNGVATFTFMRAQDLGPAGRTDYLVFASAGALPHDNKLAVSGNAIQEVSYQARTQTGAAANPVTLLNREASFKFTVRGTETAVGGGGPIQGWVPQIMVRNADLDVKAASKAGVVTFTDLDNPANLPATYEISLGDSTPEAITLDELYKGTAEPSANATADSTKTKLVYVHDGLNLPNEPHDLGTLRVKYTTQTLEVGVHLERDQAVGYRRSELDGGDIRPSVSSSDLEVTLEYIDAQGNDRPWEYPEGTPASIVGDGATRSPDATGIVTYKRLPADVEFELEFDAEGDDVQDLGDDEIETYWFTDGRDADARNRANRGQHSYGAFGEESGSSPGVRLCPLANATGLTNCSTFAFSRTDGSISGSVETLAGGTPTTTASSRILVTLTPRSTNMGSKARKAMVDTAGSDGSFEFEGLGGGSYTVSVASTSNWRSASKAQTFFLYTADDATPSPTFTRMASAFEVSYLKTVIAGTVVNDNANISGGARDNVVQSVETRAGVKLTLHRVVDIRDRGAITHDTVDAKRSTTTAADGTYSFTNVEEGVYIVEGVNTDDYELRSTRTTAYNQTGWITTTAANDSVGSRSVLPYWNYGGTNVASTLLPVPLAENAQQTDFLILNKDAKISGKVLTDNLVNDPDTDYDDPVSGIRLVALLCRSVAENITLGITAVRECTRPDTDTGVVSRYETTTNAKGEYEFTDIREGLWIVDVDSESYGDFNEDHANSIAFNRAAWLTGKGDSETLDFQLVLNP